MLGLTTLCYPGIMTASSTQLTLPMLNVIHFTRGNFPCGVSRILVLCTVGCDPSLKKMEWALYVCLEGEAQKGLSGGPVVREATW